MPIFAATKAVKICFGKKNTFKDDGNSRGD